MHLRSVLLGKGHVGEHVLLGGIPQRGELRRFAARLVGDQAPLGLGRRRIGLGDGGGDEGGHDPAAVLSGVGQGISLKMHAAALPGRRENPGRGGLDALVGVADPKLHVGQASAVKGA